MASSSEDYSILSRTVAQSPSISSYGPYPDQVVEEWAPEKPVGIVVFLLHGGFWSEAYDRSHCRPLAAALCRQGISVLLPEYRRVGGGGGWPNTFDDVLSACAHVGDALRSAERSVLVGHSAGGQLALWLAASAGSLEFDVAVALAPVSDLVAADALGLGDHATRQLMGGTPGEVFERYEGVDPQILPDPQIPTVVIHGQRDSLVPVSMSREYVARHQSVRLVETDSAHFELIDPDSTQFPALHAAIIARDNAEMYSTTRAALHGVAEWLLAGPQYSRAGTIRLTVSGHGFSTRDGLVAVEGTHLRAVLDGDERRAPLRGTVRSLGELVGIEPEIPRDLYADHAPVDLDTELVVDPGAATLLIDWFIRGNQGLLGHAPGEEPVLWPEHFDLGIAHDEVNYGISPGDSFHPMPYAYVGPWKRRAGSFWTAPFGAVLAASDLPDAPSVAAFFREGATRASQDPLA